MSAGGFGQDYAEVVVEDPREPVFRRSWKPIDLSSVLEGSWSPVEPTVGRRSDGVGLFYPGKVHTVSSESEAGKTWFMLSVVLDELGRGNDVVYLDFEDDEGGITGRLLTLGADRVALASRFHYVRPEDPIGSGVHADDLDALLRDTAPTLAVLDGVTEAMTVHGLSPNDNSDAAKFGRLIPRRLAAAGAASVSLDHVTKSTETRGRYSLGAVHKLNGLDGAAYVLDNRAPFGVGLVGRSTVRIAKDRPGQLRRHALASKGDLFWMGDLVLTSQAEEFAEVEVRAPETGTSTEFRPTALMQKISDALAEHGPMPQRQILATVKGKRQYAVDALALLQRDSYVSTDTPHKLLREFDGGEVAQP